MNIILVNPEYPSPTGVGHGGTATYTYSLANALSAAGATVHVLVKKGTVPDLLGSSVCVHPFEWIPAPPLAALRERFSRTAATWEYGLSRGALQTALEIHSVTPVDVVDIPEYNGLAIAFRKPLPFPLVVNFRTPRVLIDELNCADQRTETKGWHRIEAQAIRNAGSYRTSSEALKLEAHRRFHIPLERISVIRNPVETHVFDRIKETPKLNGQTVDLLFVGRLERRKGAQVILNAIRGILDCDSRITITFAGETRFREATDFQEAIERILTPAQRKRVWFLGPLHRAELPILYRRSDVFLFPSLFENSPNALLEAMAARLPVLAANTPGVNEVIRHDRNGLLFDPISSDDLVTQIRRIIDGYDDALQRAAAAYTDVTTVYSPAVIARATIDYYATLCSGAAR